MMICHRGAAGCRIMIGGQRQQQQRANKMLLMPTRRMMVCHRDNRIQQCCTTATSPSRRRQHARRVVSIICPRHYIEETSTRIRDHDGRRRSSSSASSFVSLTTSNHTNHDPIRRRAFSSSSSSSPTTTTPRHNNNDKEDLAVTAVAEAKGDEQIEATTTTAAAKRAGEGGGGANSAGTSSASSMKAYSELAKARLSTLVVSTTMAGFVAAGGPIAAQATVLASVTAGTFLCSASAAALNQIFELERDQRMKRTQQRPLVRGDLTKTHATMMATLWGTAGTGLLALGTDPVTTCLGFGNIVLYAGVYTAMKPVSIYNTWVGAVVGAIPPIMGYTAATGGCGLLDPQPLLLGATLYLWQMPHFFALSYMHRADYKRGGFQMIPCLDDDVDDEGRMSSRGDEDPSSAAKRTADVIVRYAWYLSTVPLIATATGVTSTMFALEGIVLNAYALKVAHDFGREQTNGNARKIFLTSLWYLPCFLMLFLLHSTVFDEQENEEVVAIEGTRGEELINTKKQREPDVAAQLLTETIRNIRQKGREICVHEAVVQRQHSKTSVTDQQNRGDSGSAGAKACPVVIAERRTVEAAEKVNATVSEIRQQQQQQNQQRQCEKEG